ncbi:hypothetical protein QYE76_071771 [Lolium multiflorum]|uniref:Uncharacterized protein n=1 Tax=Lolium multiflorum TaxID=4521 RepID=A0AAD8SM81_LOLMU|nr:hypothetical protein QYE76_071771 [Lolium multiflorum]
MSASPEFCKPAAVPDYTARLFVAADEDNSYVYRTPTGTRINYLGEPATCPPAPRKPRPPPASACRKRLFTAGDVITLRFDNLKESSALPRSGQPAARPRRGRAQQQLQHKGRWHHLR